MISSIRKADTLAMVKTFGVKSLDPFPNRDMTSSFLPSFLSKWLDGLGSTPKT
jgi:hypothetical protein